MFATTSKPMTSVHTEKERASDDGRYRDTDRVIGCHINRNANKGRYMTNEEKFVNELIGYIFAYPDDDYMTMECLCRKLHKYGLIDKKDGEWTTDFIDHKTDPSLSDKPTSSKDEPTTQKETQNSNLTFKTLEYCNICDHKGCEECISNALDEHCIPSQFKKQIEDECAKEYEELGLKELKELIKADRKTEPTISKMEQVDKDINVRSKDEPQPSKIIEAYAKGYKDGADAVKGIKDKQIRACDICKYEIGETCTHPKVKTMKKEWASFEGDLWGEENTPKWCPIDKDEPQTDGILFKGNLKEGDYKLIKTTNGWVLEGNDIAYYGEPQTERSSE